MTALIHFFFNISILRAKPQSLPASPFLMISTLTAYGLISLLISLIELPVIQAFFSALVDTALLVTLAFISLWIIDTPERRLQTITALAGTGSLLQLIAWPILLWLSSVGEADNSTLLYIPRWGLLLLVIWNILVIAHILRHALSVSLPITFGISVLYMYFAIRIANILFIAAR
jgi:hypothetical protein